MELLFGNTVNVSFLDPINRLILKVGSVTIDISEHSRIHLTVPNKVSETSHATERATFYIIQKKYITFLYKKYDYSLELLEDQLIEKSIPFYDMVYILIYVKAYHDTVLSYNL